MAPAVAPPPAPIRKKLIRRAAPDRSQALRRGVQVAFFALNAWIGVQFFVREGTLLGFPYVQRCAEKLVAQLIAGRLAKPAGDADPGSCRCVPRCIE